MQSTFVHRRAFHIQTIFFFYLSSKTASQMLMKLGHNDWWGIRIYTYEGPDYGTQKRGLMVSCGHVVLNLQTTSLPFKKFPRGPRVNNKSHNSSVKMIRTRLPNYQTSFIEVGTKIGISASHLFLLINLISISIHQDHFSICNT